MMRPKKKVDKHIEKKDAVISGAEEKLLKDTVKLQAEIEQAVTEELFSFENKDGKLIRNKKNYDKINSLANKIKKQASEGGYITDYLKSFDEIEAINSDIHQDLHSIEIDVNKVSRYKQELVNDIIENLTGAGMDVNFIQPARQILFKNVTLGTPISQLAKEMKVYLIGVEDKPGKLSRYATTVTRDVVSQYDGAINASVQMEFGMDCILYVGSIIATSAPQCKHWASMDYIRIDKLKEEIAEAKSKWSKFGFNPNTNIYNFCVNRGHNGCRHSAIPSYIELQEK